MQKLLMKFSYILCHLYQLKMQKMSKCSTLKIYLSFIIWNIMSFHAGTMFGYGCRTSVYSSVCLSLSASVSTSQNAVRFQTIQQFMHFTQQQKFMYLAFLSASIPHVLMLGFVPRVASDSRNLGLIQQPYTVYS